MKLGYGYRRSEAELIAAGADPEQVYIDLRSDRPMRDDLILAAREGDEVIVLYARDFGGSPVADRVWRERLEAQGARLVEVRPIATSRPVGRPRKFTPDDDLDRRVRAIWLGGGSEATRLRRVADVAGHEVGKGTLVHRYGSPSNPKPIAE